MHPKKRRFIVCFDGTWQDSVEEPWKPYTNVARFRDCIRQWPEEQGDYLWVQQEVIYLEGVGCSTSKVKKGLQGSIGGGIADKILDAYFELCRRYDFDTGEDEIYMVGFSRGAFAARCLVCLIDELGLVKKEIWQFGKDDFRKMYFDMWAGARKGDDDVKLKERKHEWYQQGLIDPTVRVVACGLWDTVRKLGSTEPEFAVHGSCFPAKLGMLLHALALDENRVAFRPRLWKHLPGRGQRLKQCWFRGVHSDVGGGNLDAGLANVSLIWIVAQMKQHTELEFDMAKLLELLSPVRLVKNESNHVADRLLGNTAEKASQPGRYSISNTVTVGTVHPGPRLEFMLEPRASHFDSAWNHRQEGAGDDEFGNRASHAVHRSVRLKEEHRDQSEAPCSLLSDFAHHVGNDGRTVWKCTKDDRWIFEEESCPLEHLLQREWAKREKVWLTSDNGTAFFNDIRTEFPKDGLSILIPGAKLSVDSDVHELREQAFSQMLGPYTRSMTTLSQAERTERILTATSRSRSFENLAAGRREFAPRSVTIHESEDEWRDSAHAILQTAGSSPSLVSPLYLDSDKGFESGQAVAGAEAEGSECEASSSAGDVESSVDSFSELGDADSDTTGPGHRRPRLRHASSAILFEPRDSPTVPLYGSHGPRLSHETFLGMVSDVPSASPTDSNYSPPLFRAITATVKRVGGNLS